MLLEIAIVFLLVVAGIVAFKRLRPKFPSKVCCWFCDHKTSVPYEFRNCWDCPQCEQYNGFNQDGDYNKLIPAQYDELLNTPAGSDGITEEFLGGQDHFCTRCSQNQLMKIKQLANFIPYNEANYDYEVAVFKAHLEKVYKLCRDCEIRVQQELDMQNRAIFKRLENLDDTQRSFLEKPSSGGTAEQTFLHSSYVDRSINWPVVSSLILHTASLTCSSLLTAKHVNLDGPAAWQKWLLAAHPLLLWLDKNAAVVAGTGILTAVIARLILGKDRLYIMDALGLPVWLLVLLSETGYLPLNTEPVYEMAVLVVNCAACVVCLCQNRNLRNQPNISVIRHQLDSSISSTSGIVSPCTSNNQVTPDPGSSQSTEGQNSRSKSNQVDSSNQKSRSNYWLRSNDDDEKIVTPNASSAAPAVGQGSQKPLLGSRSNLLEQMDNDLDLGEGQSGTKVMKGQGDTSLTESRASTASSKDSMDDNLPDLNFVSLGTPSVIKRSNSGGLFASASQSCLPSSSQPVVEGLRHRHTGEKRPLILPAAFNHKSSQSIGKSETLSCSQSFGLFSQAAQQVCSTTPISFTARASTPLDWTSSPVNRSTPVDHSSNTLFQSVPSAFKPTVLYSSERHSFLPERPVSPVVTAFGTTPFANIIPQSNSSIDRHSQCSGGTLPSSFTILRHQRSASTVVSSKQRDSSVAGTLSRQPLFKPIREVKAEFPTEMDSDVEDDDLISVSRLGKPLLPPGVEMKQATNREKTYFGPPLWGCIYMLVGMVFGASLVLNIKNYYF